MKTGVQVSASVARPTQSLTGNIEREFFIDNLMVRAHFIIEMIRCTGLAQWEFEFPFSDSLISTFVGHWQRTSILVVKNVAGSQHSKALLT